MKKLTLFLLLIMIVLGQPVIWPANKIFAEEKSVEKQHDWKTLEQIFGRKGKMQDSVFKVTFPRSDLKVKVGEVLIDPGLALTGWLAFQPHGNETMMMGDLVLLDTEVPQAISKLSSSGIEITGLHNHQAIMGQKGHRSGNLLQFNISRAETITENNMVIPPFMGVASPINFQAVGKKAATTGDFVLLANEVNPVVRALTEHGITVTAIHNHMLVESPRLFFLHFWGVDDPEKLARGLKAALEKTYHVKEK
ncbi:DUF1259 domain-containing protein [Paenibacillus tyrfis]|uniref:DUF1259 domain-containing protein n=1 Tax=Paenibacillus tyrfis TaxID=1501230 RepID=UPI00209F202A|nr:DUF1259 domain-containing protein [Paenibacillus tyrfis]MCP1306852.1 DUF1259 domain-containing protein [Paenibacillus tyrfis]